MTARRIRRGVVWDRTGEGRGNGWARGIIWDRLAALGVSSSGWGLGAHWGGRDSNTWGRGTNWGRGGTWNRVAESLRGGSWNRSNSWTRIATA